ncbi:hypothetical protein CEXT_4371 [Caerostris extrusa]|uniref:Uncharacterized protein n=1 Tax=Caerostris extrusa TaxID=172846 RepID=A0AAV4R2F4_CAEEX|nr:hypothetical protein CEXT_4371 [Caerostris extrusa]
MNSLPWHRNSKQTHSLSHGYFHIVRGRGLQNRLVASTLLCYRAFKAFCFTQNWNFFDFLFVWDNGSLLIGSLGYDPAHKLAHPVSEEAKNRVSPETSTRNANSRSLDEWERAALAPERSKTAAERNGMNERQSHSKYFGRIGAHDIIN